MLIRILTLFYFLASAVLSHSQELVLLQRKLTLAQKKDGVTYLFECQEKGAFYVQRLLLYNDGRFSFKVDAFSVNGIAMGKWQKKGNVLYLENEIKAKAVPAKLEYDTSAVELIGGFKIGIVKNLLGKEMTDGMIAVNNDSTICLPSYGGMCDLTLRTVDSVKVIFENGMSTGYMKIDRTNYFRVTPVIQSQFIMSNYWSVDSWRYIWKKGRLIFIKSN